ncbi:unnamed protein product, partial [Brenthis ino]
MTTYSLDAETFINEIKKHRELWDLSSDGNRYKSIVKQCAWSKVARVFIPDFDNMKDLEKLDVFRKLHGKWRNIRDAYVRNLKRKDGKREYMYAKHLTFLNSRYAGTQTHGNSDDDSSDEDKTTDSTKSKNIDLIPSQSDEEPSTIVNLKRQRVEKTMNIEFVDTPSVLSSVDFNHYGEDEDRSFFDSLLPAVREFDLDQKLEFRCEVIKLIKYIRSGRSRLKTERQTDGYDS